MHLRRAVMLKPRETEAYLVLAQLHMEQRQPDEAVKVVEDLSAALPGETSGYRRLGLVLRHRELGYRANAMTVWDVPDERVPDAAAALTRLPFVTLCYRRPRRPPVWPYNLFCMIHGQDRALVLAEVEEATAVAGLSGLPRAVLFSRRCFKQRGARYAPKDATWTSSTAAS